MPNELANAIKQVDPGPKKNDIYMATATLQHFKPMLDKALEKKDPKGFKKFTGELVDRSKAAKELYMSGKNKEYDAANAEKQSWIQGGSDFHTALTPDEMKAVLGDDYDQYASAYKLLQSTTPRNIKGESEQAGQFGDIMYGRRFMTQGGNTGISGKDFNLQYIYDPKLKKPVLDMSRTTGNYQQWLNY